MGRQENMIAPKKIAIHVFVAMAVIAACGGSIALAQNSAPAAQTLAQAGGSAAAPAAPRPPVSAGPCGPPHEYIRLISAGQYDSVGGLFSGDAVYMGPDGKTRHGSKAVGAFYSEFLPKLKPMLMASIYMQQGNECMMELENKDSKTGEYMAAAVDHFTVNADGKISKFVVFLRPGSATQRDIRTATANIK